MNLEKRKQEIKVRLNEIKGLAGSVSFRLPDDKYISYLRAA